MGLNEGNEFIDLFSFDPTTAAEFGLPVDQCKAMILLFPLGENDKEEAKNEGDFFDSPKFMKQTIDNSCCMMALLHILLNNPKDLLQVDTPEVIKKLLDNSNDLEKIIEESNELESIHKEMAMGGGTEVPDISDNVPFHFVALIPSKNRSLFLMDGRRSGPIEYKITDEMSFFESACKIANEDFVMKSSDQTNFAAVILI